MTVPGPSSMPPARRRPAVVACGVALLCLVAAPAAVDAVKPKSGAFGGKAKVPGLAPEVGFEVSSSRKRLREVRFPGCGGRKVVGSPITAKVSKKGKIKGSAFLRERYPPEVPGPTESLYEFTYKISGRFTTPTKAKGRLSMVVRDRTVLTGTDTSPPGDRRGTRTCRSGSVTWKAKRL